MDSNLGEKAREISLVNGVGLMGGIVMTAIGAALIVFKIAPLSGIFLVVSALVLGIVSQVNRSLAIYEQALVLETLFGKQVLPWADITEVIFDQPPPRGIQRRLNRGFLLRDLPLSMVVVMLAGGGWLGVLFGDSFQRQQDFRCVIRHKGRRALYFAGHHDVMEIYQIIDQHTADLLAVQAISKMEANEPVLLSPGLTYDRKGLSGTYAATSHYKRTVSLAWAEIDGTSKGEGWFHILSGGKKAISIPMCEISNAAAFGKVAAKLKKRKAE